MYTYPRTQAIYAQHVLTYTRLTSTFTQTGMNKAFYGNILFSPFQYLADGKTSAHMAQQVLVRRRLQDSAASI